MKDRTLVTGATGFVGAAVVKQLLRDRHTVRIAVRQSLEESCQVEVVYVGGIGRSTNWESALSNVGCVIHCAARVPVLRDATSDGLLAYREVNVEGTRQLALKASECGVRRMVFVSSIKVNGERTKPGAPFSFSDPAAPEDAYGQSKWEAEQVLRHVAADTGLEVVIVRPPLVYGPGVKGNFARLFQLIKRGVPLPLGAIDNRRSLVALDNLVHLLVLCADHPAAAGNTFLVSDGKDLSTPDLILRQGRAMGRPVRLVSVPVGILRIAGRLTGRSTEIERLVECLQVDISHTRKTLDWAPPVSIDEGFKRVAEHAGG